MFCDLKGSYEYLWRHIKLRSTVPLPVHVVPAQTFCNEVTVLPGGAHFTPLHHHAHWLQQQHLVKKGYFIGMMWLIILARKKRAQRKPRQDFLASPFNKYRFFLINAICCRGRHCHTWWFSYCLNMLPPVIFLQQTILLIISKERNISISLVYKIF